MADEICLQMHLLNLSFVIAVAKRAGANLDLATEICIKQLIGVAGRAAERIHRALRLPGGIEGAARTLQLHPMLNPAVRAVDPRLDVEVSGGREDWAARINENEAAAEEFAEVSVVKVSCGASWEFEDRNSLPLTVL